MANLILRMNKEDTPDSVPESPSDITDAAAVAAITIKGQKAAAVAIEAAMKAAKPTNIPTTVEDDSIALTTEIPLTQDQMNETNRIQANCSNLGTSVSNMTTYLDALNIKE